MSCISIARATLITGITAAGLFAQATATAVISSVPPTLVAGRPMMVGMAGPMGNVTGQPFSGLQETETIQTLADGTHITNGKQKVTYYRDSLGRVRTERTAMQPQGMTAYASGNSAPPVFIEIQDPVAGVRYSFNSNDKVAHRMSYQPLTLPSRLAARPNGAPAPSLTQVITRNAMGVTTAVVPAGQQIRPEISTESLGAQTIEGVTAEGNRTTTTWPVDSIGNDRPVTSVNETWMSQELGMPVLTKNSDLRSGEMTMKMTNISRSEPNASLFQPPAGYEIVDPSAQKP